MSDRPPASEITEEELAALYQQLDDARTDAAKLRRVYEWSVARWEVERRRLAADIEWMRASVPPAELVSQLRETTREMSEAAPDSPGMSDWERRWADHFTAMGFRLKRAEEALGREVP